MSQGKDCSQDVREVAEVASEVNLGEEERQGYATISEIRRGIFGFLASVMRAMGFLPCWTAHCPVCGSSEVTSHIRRSRIVVDGPTYMEVKCGKCGHKWNLLLRSGP